MNYLIIAAGGSGERMGSKDNKVFLKIDDKEILYWTLGIFERNSMINGIVISARPVTKRKLKILF